MLFNSFEFIFFFLPVVVIGYFVLSRYSQSSVLANTWILASSLVFYGWSNPSNVILILSSIVFNYMMGALIERSNKNHHRKVVLIIGVVANVLLLGYYKYTDFLIENVNEVLATGWNLRNIILPIGISFFTFQQIAFLVDIYKREIKEYNFLSYSIFVSFFPQLIAGPIVHHKEMMPQFKSTVSASVNWENVLKGILLFNMGLAKKIVIADTFGKIVGLGFGNTTLLTPHESWIASLAYSFQLYFDFSGYSDMALGLGLLFNIQLPINFFSPYKSTSIKDFWRRWHITLSRFLRDYIYIPLGGNRQGVSRMHLNLLITFLIGGVWHGAGWTFIFWGFLHGLGLIVHSYFQKSRINLPRSISIALTFLFVNITWVFFRASNWTDAWDLIGRMAFLVSPDNDFKLIVSFYDFPIWLVGIALLFFNNTNEVIDKFKHNKRMILLMGFLILLNLTFLNSSLKQEFLYFDF